MRNLRSPAKSEELLVVSYGKAQISCQVRTSLGKMHQRNLARMLAARTPQTKLLKSKTPSTTCPPPNGLHWGGVCLITSVHGIESMGALKIGLGHMKWLVSFLASLLDTQNGSEFHFEKPLRAFCLAFKKETTRKPKRRQYSPIAAHAEWIKASSGERRRYGSAETLQSGHKPRHTVSGRNPFRTTLKP